MAEVDPKLVNEMEDFGMKKKILRDGTVLWSGPHLKNADGSRKWFDGGYTEALMANVNENQRVTNLAHGLNFAGQTKEQEQAFKKRMEVTKKNKEKAAVILQASEQLK